ncbi:MAG TPA: hypothetical protein ENI27_07680 [bacterium]|nr:hypothetical protein [bacterium]
MIEKPRRVKLEGKEYWDFLLTVFELDDWRCRVCGRIRPLQGHHMKKRSQGRLDVVENVVSLCYECHEHVERGRIKIVPIDMKKRIIRVRRQHEGVPGGEGRGI